MPHICYVEKDFQSQTLDVIEAANAIIEEYQGEGYDLTLRQLYYQFVARDLIPNDQRSYKRIGSIINDARLGGYIDWGAIEDRTRSLTSWRHFDTPEMAMAYIARTYALDRWTDQPVYIEVWIEKEALAGVMERVCGELDVPFFSCRGYVSQSEMWSAAQRLRAVAGLRSHNGTKAGDSARDAVILHFGDHDPSGIDMTRDIEDRLALFGAPTTVERLALNAGQIDEFNPPPNPAKVTDSRARDYIARFGRSSWELDALDPRTLAGLVRTAVEDYRDDDEWERVEAAERIDKRVMRSIGQRWDDVLEYLGDS